MVAVAGKVVVVTGGRRGLGAALVDEVLARGARKVYSTARAAYTDDRKQVVTHELQVRSPDSVAALAQIATDAEIVFNNAGVLVPESLLTGSFEHVTETFDVNVFGPLRVTRAFAPILAANGGGAVVNLHSVLSWLGGAGAYGASKAAMWSVTNSLRAELERQNTQVVGVHTGFIDTDMVSAIPVPKMTPPEVAQRIVAGLEDGAVEVLTDDITINVKAALSGPVERLTFALAHCPRQPRSTALSCHYGRVITPPGSSARRKNTSSHRGSPITTSASGCPGSTWLRSSTRRGPRISMSAGNRPRSGFASSSTTSPGKAPIRKAENRSPAGSSAYCIPTWESMRDCTGSSTPTRPARTSG